MARAPTSSGASAISPCGASVTLNTATTIAAAAGHSLSGADGVLDQHPGGDGAERDERLGAQAVVERQPRGQEHRARRPAP